MFGWRGRGFRGWSPDWPYVGIGRGGLPRCWHPGFWGWWRHRYPYTYSKEDELNFLKEEADALRAYLADLEARIKELESK